MGNKTVDKIRSVEAKINLIAIFILKLATTMLRIKIFYVNIAIFYANGELNYFFPINFKHDIVHMLTPINLSNNICNYDSKKI